MTLSQYLEHYLSFPEILIFLLVSTAVLAVIHLILYLISSRIYNAGSSRRNAGRNSIEKEMLYNSERYYELMFASTSILFFTGLYFLIGYRYFELSEEFYTIWDKYSDFLLLLFLFFSILMIDVLDSLLIPLKEISNDEKSSLRMAAMIYMLVIFGYIKFIYDDNNYDAIIIYFLIMIIGRFIYFDASFKDFIRAMKELAGALPCLLLVLATTGMMALYGFSSGYLRKDNGVVVSLWIAHIFLIIEIIPLFFVMRNKVRKAAKHRKKVNSQNNYRNERNYNNDHDYRNERNYNNDHDYRNE